MIASSWVKQSVITVLCVLGIPSYLSAPKPISVSLEGESTITVPANRAIISLRIYSEGPKQDKVADEVRKAADEILGTLRPLAQVATSPSSHNLTSNATTISIVPDEPAIVDLSVTAFRSYSYQIPGSFLKSETPKYESSIEIEAEFRCFDALGSLLAQVSKIPLVNVQSLKWKLDDTTKRKLLVKCREQAMVDALEKVHAYVRPLGMDKVRAIRVTESYQRSSGVVMADLLGGGVRFQQGADDWSRQETLMMGSSELPGDDQPSKTLKLEPKTLVIAAHIDGEFCAWKTGLEAWFRRGGVTPIQIQG
ncbi:uncharacterized protein A1O9_10631 [Exophiala aquamarina CBS 119918]|uniref:Peptidase M20 dimerisation domain-containing protein n=1 Tax=Exophiala aquamarina CBS 119918 TaxID=1182545 RepID=A0A072P1N3_9EURO|nr:uncharacterized protein A1O9_10631 [Exophiala aquamarina CBS 119918]KEF53183.1 hypothetical protein A1O9_10631 [Exophiala aquamarina CBS 119918]